MNDRSDILAGTVASRMCPLCGHHEVGLVTKDGEFFALKQGMEVRIHGPSVADPLPSKEEASPLRKVSPQEDTEGWFPWAPDPMLSNRGLRMKYTVRIRADQAQIMSPEIYRLAYIEKLKSLIEKEIFVPLPVILDRFFSAPHLAAGDPRQIAEAMWRELMEVREPVQRVEEWLISGRSSIFPEEGERKDPEISGRLYSVEDILKELEELSIEDFLALL